jgi:hypothetical protein
VQRTCPYYKDCQPEGRYPIDALLKPIEEKKKRTSKTLAGLAEKLTENISGDSDEASPPVNTATIAGTKKEGLSFVKRS